MTLPSATPILSDRGLAVIQDQADVISREVTEAYFAAHPQCMKGDPARIRAMCKADFQHHLDFLLTSLRTGTQAIFCDYAIWLKGVLQSRNLAIDHPIESFGFMKTALAGRLAAEDGRLCSDTLDCAIALMRQSNTNKPARPSAIVCAQGSPEFTQALVAGDKKAVDSLATQSLSNGVVLMDLEVGMIQPAMYEVGRLWANNQVTVAQEHLATAIAQNVLAKAFLSAPFSDPINKRALCACVEGNYHALGLRMVSDAFELRGWDATFLGANTPNASVLAHLAQETPDVLALSVSMPHQILALKQLIDEIRSTMGAKAPAIIIGGLAINHHQLHQTLKIDNWYPDARELWKDIQ